MSVKIITKVWEWSRAEGNARLVMLALADFCDDDATCYPGIKRVARKCRLSERTVQRLMAAIEKTGELERLICGGAKVPGPRGDGCTNAYKLILKGCQDVTPIEKGVTNPTPATEVGGDIAVSPKPPVEPSGGEKSFALTPTPPAVKKVRVGTVNGHKPPQDEIETYCESIGLPRSDGSFMLDRWDARGWPKNWQADIRVYRRSGWLESQRFGAKATQPSAPLTDYQPRYDEFLASHPNPATRATAPKKYAGLASNGSWNYLDSEFCRWLKSGKYG